MSKPVKIAWALILGLCLSLIFIAPSTASPQVRYGWDTNHQRFIEDTVRLLKKKEKFYPKPSEEAPPDLNEQNIIRWLKAGNDYEDLDNVANLNPFAPRCLPSRHHFYDFMPGVAGVFFLFLKNYQRQIKF